MLTPKEGYAPIEWSILILIYGMLALGWRCRPPAPPTCWRAGWWPLASVDAVPEAWALRRAGGLWLPDHHGDDRDPVEQRHGGADGAAGAQPRAQLGVDPRPFVIATCIAASASFSTPIGYQTNTYVYGVAGYRFSDFARIGVPLNLLYFVTGIVLVPMIWPFSG